MLQQLAATLFLAIPLLATGVPCERLVSKRLPQTKIVSAESVPANAAQTSDGLSLDHRPAFCRVKGILQPSADSDIRFEVWLPTENWNHRFLGVGNGGFAGSIDYHALSGNLGRGFATAATDTGHQGESTDASWAYHHPGKVTDFGYRALHLTVETAKALLTAFYGESQGHAYFDSCSNGGREGLMEAQRYPGDFDGILAGAPAYDWTQLLAVGIEANQALFANPRSYVPPVKIPAIHKAVLEACHAENGIIEDPARCQFDPVVLLCRGEESSKCLTAPQIQSLKQLYGTEPMQPALHGTAEYLGHIGHSGFVPGAEEGPGGWKSWVLGDAPGFSLGAAFVQNFYRYMGDQQPAWNVLHADPALELGQASSVAKILDATNPDLHEFVGHGGKLILYHGWNDPALSPWATIDYFEQAISVLGSDAAKSSMRLYMVPGMQHCTGGPGASAFGQLGLETSEGDPYGVFAALEQWVEQGKEPSEIVATKWIGEGEKRKVDLTRPLCAYPSVPEYNGSGDSKRAKNFHCVSR